MKVPALALVGALSLVLAHPANADEDPWAQCGAGLAAPLPPAGTAHDGDAETVHVSADEADLSEGDRSVLRGDVLIRRGGVQVSAQRVVYNKTEETIDALGTVRLWDGPLFVEGDSGTMDLVAETAHLDRTRFVLADAHGRGSAESLDVKGNEWVVVSEAVYTTCNPGDAAWALHAREIELNRVTRVGAAKHVWLELNTLPVFYTPYLTFPLGNERKSGLLPPSGGVSGSTGVELTVPYYFNLAPNYDATLAARAMTDRGVQAQGEFRYLTGWGEGRVGGEFLPHDRQQGDDRSAFSFDHEGGFGRRWTTEATVSWVSDSDYFEDLGTDLAISSRRHLERRGDLRYDGRGWWTRLRAQDYQTIDDTLAVTDRPYERLPQLYFTTDRRERNRRVNLGVRAEAVHFDRDASVTGSRLDLRPSVSFPMRTAGTFFVPSAAVELSHYELSGTARGVDDSPGRLVPTLSADSGLLFERDLELGGRSWLQTLEPRAYYLLVPFDDQTDLPVFDTGRNTFSFAQLFRNDRFNGADRVGDAHQVSLAVTSRLLSPDTGSEWLRASVGQIRHFRDRRVTLPGAPRETASGSALVGELSASIDRSWRALAGMQWSPHDERTERSTLALRYQPDERRVVNAAYRFVRETRFTSRDSIEQVDFSFAWPVAPDLRAVGRWNYATAEGRTLETFAGLEYESCCWALRTVVRRYLANDRGEHTNSVFLQLELKGLGGLGGGTERFLRRNIPGYENEF